MKHGPTYFCQARRNISTLEQTMWAMIVKICMCCLRMCVSYNVHTINQVSIFTALGQVWLRDQAIVTEPTRSPLGGGQTYLKLDGGGGREISEAG